MKFQKIAINKLLVITSMAVSYLAIKDVESGAVVVNVKAQEYFHNAS